MIIWHLRADDDLNLKLKLQVIYFLLIVILLLTADSQSTTSPFITFPRMRWIICSFNKQPFIRESSHFSRHEETGCLSGGDIMTEGIIGGSENEKENRAELPSDEGRRIWGDKRPKWSAERPGGKTGFFLSCSFICLCLSGRAKVIHVCPSNAVGSSPRDLKGGVIEQRLWLRDETRGALASLRVSMVAAVVSPFSPDICRSFFSLFFCLRTVLSRRHGNRFPTPAPDILTYHASIIIDVRSVSCWCLKPQIEFTTDHSSKVITPFKGAKSQTFRPFPHVYHPVSQCWIVKRKKDGLSRKRECSPHITVLCI